MQKAGRYGADVATVGGMVQLVTRGILLDTMRVDSSDEEIEIRVRLPEEDRILSTLDTLKVRTRDGLVPLSNFTTRTPVPSLSEISRVDQKRFFDVKSDALSGLQKLVTETEAEDGETTQEIIATLIPSGGDGVVTSEDGTAYDLLQGVNDDLQARLDTGDLRLVPINPNERIEVITKWLETAPFANGIEWEWTGDQEDQEESAAFLSSAFSAALGLMFIILLAQFNSLYNAVLVLMAVVLSTTGVLWGMLLMGQTFSIIMTGTGIVALAGIVVNNNIVLIDTYNRFRAEGQPPRAAALQTGLLRARPVCLTAITTILGLMPMVLSLNIDLFNRVIEVGAPSTMWWTQLASAIAGGLGFATILTLMLTPCLLVLGDSVGKRSAQTNDPEPAINLAANES